MNLQARCVRKSRPLVLGGESGACRGRGEEMGYLRDMYGIRNPEFVKGFLAAAVIIKDYPQWEIESIMRDAINEMALHPEDFDLDLILQRGYV